LGKIIMAKNRRIVKNTSSFDMDDVVKSVVAAQAATAHIPALVRKELEKSWKQLPNSDADRSQKTWMHDPLALQYSLGYKDRRFSLTYDVLKRIAGQLSIISAIINTRCSQVATFAQPYRWTKSLGFVVKHKDPDHTTTPAEVAFIKELEDFVMRCGKAERNPYSNIQRDDFETFLRKITRDTLQYDQVSFEIVPDRLNIPFEFLAVDASTIRIAADDRYVGVNASYHDRTGFIPSMPARFANLYQGREYGVPSSGGKAPISYVQIINGQIENVYSSDELAFGVRNPRSDIYIQGYGYGELEQLITVVTAHLFTEEHNRRYFCLPRHTKVFTLNGIKTIEQCYLETIPNKIWTGTKWADYRVVKTGVKRMCRLRTKGDYVVETSNNHRFYSIPENSTTGLPEWKHQHELKVGDRVLLNKNVVKFNKPNTSFIEKPNNTARSRGFSIDSIKSDLYEVLGWWLGDGSIGRCSNDALSWCYRRNSEEYIADIHQQILEQYGLIVNRKTITLDGVAKDSGGESGPRLCVYNNYRK
jgi:hypothetical protein